MTTLAVKSCGSISYHLLFSLLVTSNSLCIFRFQIFRFFVTVTSEDGCCSMRNVMRSSRVMFVAVVSILFLVKFKWPKNMSVYEVETRYICIKVL